MWNDTVKMNWPVRAGLIRSVSAPASSLQSAASTGTEPKLENNPDEIE